MDVENGMRDKLLGRKSRWFWGKNSKKEWRLKEREQVKNWDKDY